MNHVLKCEPQYFRDVWNGHKKFELRKNDRDFAMGDTLLMQEVINSGSTYTGRSIFAQVNYIAKKLEKFGLEEGYCIMSIETLARHPVPEADRKDQP